MWGSAKLHYDLCVYILNYTDADQSHTTKSVTFGAKNVTLASKLKINNDFVFTVKALAVGYLNN